MSPHVFVYLYETHRDGFHATAGQEHEWIRGVNGRGGQRARSQMSVSSVGEDRAILLGFTMMAFSVLMFFVVGITMVKPFTVLQLVNVYWVDCRGVSTVPCLRVMVNLTGSNQSAFLHFDEESVLLAPECFYIPKCQMERADLQAEVQGVKRILDTQLGSTSSCFTDHTRHPRDVILSRKYTLKKALFALLWPCLMLCGGALLVGLVKLTQCLAHLSSEVCSETTGSRVTSSSTQGKLYRLLRRSSMQSPS
uniref:Potassium calcium-activated channel subfamily M regulatory beta subunit 3 n=1 Tax=Seriola lalandi dorsalis TaxID=1841481 RepID=A0A3B4XRJ6_SERLL